MSCAWETSVAAYALGTLDRAERARLVEHLPGCPRCREALEQVAGLPGLLARVDRELVVTGPAVPEERMFDRLLAAALAERRRGRRRLVLAAAAAAVVLAGAGVGLAVALPGSPTDHRGRVVAAAEGPVHARTWLHPTASGTELTLQLSGVASGERCQLVAVDTAGHREVAASWQATYDGQATVSGSTAIPVSRLARLVVQTPAGRQLVVLPVRS